MIAAKANRKAERTESRLLRALVGRLERYMARAGLIAFMADPADPPAAPPAAPAPPPADPPAAPPADPPAAPAPSPAPAAPAPSPAPAPAGAPETYEAFTLPEGVTLDAAHLDKVSALAKELGLPQDKAQQLATLSAELQAGNAAQLQTAIDAQAEKWAADAKADKEIGGDKFDESLAAGKKAMAQFATPEFVAFLNESKLGNHPEMLRMWFRVSQAVGEDGFVPGRSAGGPRGAQAMYANSNMNP